mmetsp:Transcript_5531/g.702  ORF Transcript_5531/g.702 Transcript_5531/m.702 type:complete len:93 (+) Transcript_5531:1139-1417(+)
MVNAMKLVTTKSVSMTIKSAFVLKGAMLVKREITYAKKSAIMKSVIGMVTIALNVRIIVLYSCEEILNVMIHVTMISVILIMGTVCVVMIVI